MDIKNLIDHLFHKENIPQFSQDVFYMIEEYQKCVISDVNIPKKEKFKIDGLGVYKTTDGLKAEVVYRSARKEGDVFLAVIHKNVGQIYSQWFRKDGVATISDCGISDIVYKWEE
jgi:hypothetical protein